jgi:hypothetical protein
MAMLAQPPPETNTREPGRNRKSPTSALPGEVFLAVR